MQLGAWLAHHNDRDRAAHNTVAMRQRRLMACSLSAGLLEVGGGFERCNYRREPLRKTVALAPRRKNSPIPIATTVGTKRQLAWRPKAATRPTAIQTTPSTARKAGLEGRLPTWTWPRSALPLILALAPALDTPPLAVTRREGFAVDTAQSLSARGAAGFGSTTLLHPPPIVTSMGEQSCQEHRRVSFTAPLDEDQLACVTAPPGPIAVIAGPGSGKTRALTLRVAHRITSGSAKPGATMVMTFTRRAACELVSRLARLGAEPVAAGTIHATAMRLLELFWSVKGISRPAILSNPERFVLEAAGLSHPGYDSAALVREIQWASARAVGPESYPEALSHAQRLPAVEASMVQEVYSKYQKLKAARNVVDVDDLPGLVVQAMREPAFAGSVRWRFRHFLVDEAQDLSRSQWRMIRCLVGDGADIFMVGDPDQAIYGWNGADACFLTELKRIFPAATTFELRTNYRCAPVVLSSSISLLGPRTAPRCSTGVLESRDDPGSFTCREFATEYEEARSVIWGLRKLRAKGVPWSEMAVLARTQKTLETVASLLSTSSIPYHTARNVLKEPAILKALSYLELSPPDLPASSCVAVLVEIAEQVIDELVGDFVTAASRSGLDASWPEADLVAAGSPAGSERRYFGAVGETHQAMGQPPRAYGGFEADELSEELRLQVKARAGMARRSLEELLALVEEYARDFPTGRLRYLRDWLNVAARSRDKRVGATGVELATFHRAKGLEWSHVFLIGLEDGLIPLRAERDESEERRLLYVAMTRAKESVSCSWARCRSGRINRSSRFVKLIEPAFPHDDLEAGCSDVKLPPDLQALRQAVTRKQGGMT